MKLCAVTVLLLFFILAQGETLNEFLQRVDRTFTSMETSVAEAQWSYETNLTEFNSNRSTQAQLEWNSFALQVVQQATQYENDNTATDDQKRQLLYVKLGGVPFDKVKQENLLSIQNKLLEIYSAATVNNITLDKLTSLMATERNEAKLLGYWEGWHSATGPKMRQLYQQLVELLNEGARDSKFPDTSEMWRAGYDMTSKEFTESLEKLWLQLQPLYTQLHCYVRQKLADYYSNKQSDDNTTNNYFGSDGYIPAHILGNMWAQDWSNLFELMIPYKNIPAVNVTPILQEKYNAVSIHKISEEFYTSLGYDPLPTSFWDKSMLTRPSDREVVCHASAWDFGKDDLRIKMCTQQNQEDLLTAHHEQGHLYYDHYYKNNIFVYRGGANDGFHEAIGDTIQLSLTPAHLREVGLLNSSTSGSGNNNNGGSSGNGLSDEFKQLINYQMLVALEKVAFLPFGYLIDEWRWSVFNGKIPTSAYNSEWWVRRMKYQGIKFPNSQRGEEFFDPGAKFHVPANVPYMRYFLAKIYQFQFHRALCKAAGQSPLHNCSIYKNKMAGDLFKSMLSMGRSKPWQDALFQATGQRELDASAILEYFSPLLTWLQNSTKNLQCGWTGNRPSDNNGSSVIEPSLTAGQVIVIIIAVLTLVITGVVIVVIRKRRESSPIGYMRVALGE